MSADGIAGARLLTAMPALKEQRWPDGLLEIGAIAEAYWQIHVQHHSARTQEFDLRPLARELMKQESGRPTS